MHVSVCVGVVTLSGTDAFVFSEQDLRKRKKLGGVDGVDAVDGSNGGGRQGWVDGAAGCRGVMEAGGGSVVKSSVGKKRGKVPLPSKEEELEVEVMYCSRYRLVTLMCCSHCRLWNPKP